MLKRQDLVNRFREAKPRDGDSAADDGRTAEDESDPHRAEPGTFPLQPPARTVQGDRPQAERRRLRRDRLRRFRFLRVFIRPVSLIGMPWIAGGLPIVLGFGASRFEERLPLEAALHEAGDGA